MAEGNMAFAGAWGSSAWASSSTTGPSSARIGRARGECAARPDAALCERSRVKGSRCPSSRVLRMGVKEHHELGVNVNVDVLSPEELAVRSRLPAFSSRRLRIYGGSSHPELTARVAKQLGLEKPNAITLKRFADGETYVRIDESVRGCDVFLIQSTCGPSVNDNVMELLLMVDACRRAHAAQVTVVIPYYGMARQDRLVAKREALSSKLIANMLVAAGTERVIVMDIHSPQTCGFFDIPLDHIYGSAPLVRHLREAHGDQLKDMVIVSPDVGGVARARALAKLLDDAPLAIIDKRRTAHNVAEVMNLIGEVDGKTAVIVDDMIDTAGTICEGARMLRRKGARAVYGMATHALFSGPAVERLSEPGLFEQVIVTDTIPIPHSKRFPQLTQVSVAQELSDAIWNAHEDFSSFCGL
ncbi:Ribose-phosphate pyrophosphokinase [Porphyridium purpureum]|uniref:ribose-phosphate diphosphokinase n=1 Tax=Porphyridium purpureum TaxID=35688 RepID=A0A5J4Z3Q7_PORPP|nr:Ribose-phosphate pyrophosphokinase [Porphyridium purpureum]|eukprot:POR3179..scf295_1